MKSYISRKFPSETRTTAPALVCFIECESGYHAIMIWDVGARATGVSMYNAGVQSREVNMKARVVIVGMTSLILGLAALTQAQGTTNEPAAVQKHVDAARAMAGTRYKTAMERLCMPPDKRPRP